MDPLSLSPSLSGISTTTKLDQLYENKENLDELESILNTPTESAEFSLPTDLSTDVLCECEDKHKCCRSYSEHTYLLGTPWVDKNGVVDDQHEVSALYLDSGCENDSGMMALMDDNNDARQLGEVATPAVDISDTRHFDGEAKSGRLSNGYLRCVSMYAGMEESSGVTDDLGCELELEAMLPLDDLGPIEQKLEDTSGYVSNDQLQHIDLQCHGDSLTVPPVLQ